MGTKTAAFAAFLWMVLSTVQECQFRELVVAVAEELSPEVPSGLVGVFANRRDKANHVRAVSAILDVPDIMSMSTGNAFSIGHLGESEYRYCILFHNDFQTDKFEACFPFTLNMKSVVQYDGKLFDVIFTATNDTMHGTINFKGKGRIDWRTGSPKEFEPNICNEKSQLAVDFQLATNGVLARFNGQNERLYRPTFYPYMFGAFELAMGRGKTNLDTLAEAEAMLQTANISDRLSLNANYWIFQGPFHKEDEFSLRVMDSRSTYRSMDLVLHSDKKSIYDPVYGQLFFTMATFQTSQTQRISKLRCEYAQSGIENTDRNLTIDFVFYSGYSWDFVIEINDREREYPIQLIYKRTVPWSYYGTYEGIPYGPSFLPEYYDWQSSKNETNCTDLTNHNRPRGRLIRIFHNVSSGNSVFQESSCPTKGTFPITFASYKTVQQNITDKRYSKIQAEGHITETGDVKIVMESSRKLYGSEPQRVRGLSFQLSPDPKTPLQKFNVNYTNVDYDAIPHTEELFVTRSTTQVASFQRIFSPLIVGKFRSQEGTEITELQITHTGPNRFNVTSTLNGQGARSEIIRYNEPFWSTAEKKMVFWHYVEFNGMVITSIHFRNSPGDNAVPQVLTGMPQVFTEDGIAYYGCSLGICEVIARITRLN